MNLGWFIAAVVVIGIAVVAFLVVISKANGVDDDERAGL